VVTVTLEALGPDQTMMTIEHEQLPPAEAENYQNGWAAVAVQLGQVIRDRRG
jgi:hypothetical protein